MYFHLIIQLNVAGASTSLAVSKIALVVEIAAILLVPFCKDSVLSTSELYGTNTPFSCLDSLGNSTMNSNSAKPFPEKTI